MKKLAILAAMIAATTQLQGTNIFTCATSEPAVGETISIGDYTFEFVAAEDDEPAVEGNLSMYSASYASNLQIAGALADAINAKTPYSAYRVGNVVYVINDNVGETLACTQAVTGATNKWSRDTMAGTAPADKPQQLCMVQQQLVAADITAGSVAFGFPHAVETFEIRITDSDRLPKDFSGDISTPMNNRMIVLHNTGGDDDLEASDYVTIFYTTEVQI